MKKRQLKAKDQGKNEKLIKEQKLEDYRIENYKIDSDARILYKVSLSFSEQNSKLFHSLPLQELDNSLVDFFFTLMETFQCENFAIYFQGDYEIMKVTNVDLLEGLNLTSEQLYFFKQFFNSLKQAILFFFETRIKPIINQLINNASLSGEVYIYEQKKKPILH